MSRADASIARAWFEAGEPLASLQLACGGTLGGRSPFPNCAPSPPKPPSWVSGCRGLRGAGGGGTHQRMGRCHPRAAQQRRRLRTRHRQLARGAHCSERRDTQLARFGVSLTAHFPNFALGSIRARGVDRRSGAPDLADLAADLIRASDAVDRFRCRHRHHARPAATLGLLDGAPVRAGSSRRWTAWLEPLDCPSRQ